MDQSAPSRHVQARGAVLVAQIGWGHLAKFARPGTLSSELRNPNSVSGRRGTGSRSGPTHRRDKTSCSWAYVSIRLMACFRAETSPNGVHRARWSHLDADKSMRLAPMLAGSHRTPGSPVNPNLIDRPKSCSNAAAVGARVSCCPAIRRRVGVPRSWDGSRIGARRGRSLDRPCCPAALGACLLPPPAGAPLVCPLTSRTGLCNGAGAVQLGGTDNGPTSAARPNPAAMELPKLAMAPSGPDSAGPSGPSAKSPRACWAACPGQAHVVGGGAQVVARHVEARRHDCVPGVGIQKLSVGRIVRARDQSSPDSPELDEPDPGAKMFHPSKMELSPGPDAAGEASDCSVLGMAEISWPSVLCWVPAGVATADEAA